MVLGSALCAEQGPVGEGEGQHEPGRPTTALVDSGQWTVWNRASGNVVARPVVHFTSVKENLE